MSQLRSHLKYTFVNYLRSIYQSLRLGSIGKKVYIEKRVAFMRFPKNIFIGDEVVLKEGSKICSCNKNAIIKIGDRTTLGYNSFIFASERIEIGEDCLIAPFVYFVDSNHQIARNAKINLQANETAPIIIGNDVWVAGNVTILKGVTIANGAVVAANSVVNTDIPPYEIWAGSPAKKIGERS